MIDKRVASPAAAVADVKDGATILCAGFGAVGMADELLEALLNQGAKDLVAVANNAGSGDRGQAACLRGRLQGGSDRARAGAAGNAERAHALRRGRARRVLFARRGGHATR